MINNLRHFCRHWFAVPLFFLFKFLLFDAVWCFYTTFKAFSSLELYLSAIGLSLLLSLPAALSRKRIYTAIVMFAADFWLVANLMYYRTYFTAIPPSSYFLAGNLADFMPSVYDSVRLTDVLFPVSTIVCLLLWRWTDRIPCKWYLSATATAFLALGIDICAGGGFERKYGSLQLSAHLYASGPALYTPAGHIAYELLSTLPELTVADEAEVTEWLAGRPALPAPDSVPRRTNLVVILAESLESWVIGSNVEGKEITPNLNRLIADSTTFYAPHILTQVKGGRSIDAQLLLLTGLLPVQSGTYSVLYPHHTYPSIVKAMNENCGTRSYLLTVDKTKTWNQGRIARAFGIDTILSYPDFRLTETAGSRKRLADGAFAEQIIEKMEVDEVWPAGENAYVQIVTYSGHAPFRLPENLRRISFSEDVPQLMADYMITANYTDAAIGRLVGYLQSRSDYAHTMIVITGDHEGLAANRASLVCRSAARGVVSDKQFTPFIVLNAPFPGRYDKVAGQVDMYPTLLQMLGIGYSWRGLGQSILDPSHPALAVGSAMNAEGDTACRSAALERLIRMHRVSDRIIRFDMLADSTRSDRR